MGDARLVIHSLGSAGTWTPRDAISTIPHFGGTYVGILVFDPGARLYAERIIRLPDGWGI